MWRKNFNNFLIGLTIGGLLAVIFWYWQKSTSAEDGALELLDRLAAAERKAGRLRLELTRQPSPAVSPAEPEAEDLAPDDLTRVKGIGPTYARRLHEAGIESFAQLTAVSPQNLAQILRTNENRAAAILAAAKGL
ncbi:MAG TPA: DUF4332 domain-containing protein [Anaerolineae bacterium]|nr:DUF4332 domain-containing protein [Anaerolineae bacterium]